MKKTYLLLLLILITIESSAQSNVRVLMRHGAVTDSTSMVELFDGFDFSDVETGFLLEAGLPHLDLKQFGSSGQEIIVSFPIIQSIVESFKSMDVSGEKEWSLDSFEAQSSMTSTSIPLWIASYDYNAFTRQAVSQVHFTNHQIVRKASANPSTLYEKHSLLAFSPGTQITSEKAISFICHYTENSNQVDGTIEFDADDGLGFRTIQDGQRISINYQTLGVKNLRIRKITSQSIDEAKSQLCITEPHPKTPTSSLVSSSSTVLDVFSNSYLGEVVSAMVSYKDCKVAGHLHTPLIIVEGYDPIGLTDAYGYWGFTTIDGVLSNNEFRNARITDHYDIYYVDWLNSEADIRCNAYLLMEIIDAINKRKHRLGSNEKNIVIGISMGGLISQYALRVMESQPHPCPHEVSHYFSHDVPYHGAIVPPGVVYALQSLQNYFESTNLSNMAGVNSFYSSYVNRINRYLYSESAQQMLINYVGRDGVVNHASFNSFQQALRNLGMPRGDNNSSPLVNISVSNGGPASSLDCYYNDNNGRLLDLDASVTPSLLVGELTFGLSNSIFAGVTDLTGHDFWGTLLSYVPGISHYHYSLSISSHVSPGQELFHMVGVYTNRILGIDIQKTFLDDSIVSNDCIPLDLVNGSYYPINENANVSAFSENPFGELSLITRLALSLLLHLDPQIKLAPRIQFVPSFSSLRYSAGIDTPSRDFRQQPLSYGETAFDSYFLPDSSQYHTSSFIWDRLIEQVNTWIDCPDTLRVGDIVRMTNSTSRSVSWVSDSSALGISQETGRVSRIKACDDAIVTGYYCESGVLVSRSQRVHLYYEEPNTSLPVYLEPHFYGDTLSMEIHSTIPTLDSLLQTYAVNRTWFYKKDIEPLEELVHHPISFTIYNFDPYSYDYKLTISAHVTAPQFGLYDVFIDYSFWNNKRIHLIQPTSIIFTPNYLLMTSDFYSGYKPLLSEPVLVGLNPTPLNNYTDNLLTNNVLFFNTLGESFPCSLNNNAWFLNGFFQNPQNQIILEQIYHSISNGGVGAFVIQMKGGVDGDPVQSFHIPVLWKDNL